MGVVHRLAAVVLLLGLTVPAVAAYDEDGNGKKWIVTVGAFMPTDGDLCGNDTQTGFTLALSHVLNRTEKGTVLGSLRYTRFDLRDNDQYVELYSPTVEYRWTSSRPVYFAVGLGTVFGANNNGGHTWSVACELAAGWEVSSNVVLEARLMRGAKAGENGFVLAAGIKL